MTRDQVEKMVTELMSQSLKYCDTDNTNNSRHRHYQVRQNYYYHVLRLLAKNFFVGESWDDSSQTGELVSPQLQIHSCIGIREHPEQEAETVVRAALHQGNIILHIPEHVLSQHQN